MPDLPLISIVTPSYNQGSYLRETLQSLVDQNYPNLEVIIQDDCSTDDSVEIAREFVRRYPKVFQLFIAEKNSGQAAAINAGFARARGEIFAFLNSDDTLCPGCLMRVAQELDPQRGRHIVFGRCVFTGEKGARYAGVEHPAYYDSHFEMLAIWKRGYNTIPQPSVFWHRKVWEECGGLDRTAGHVLDYDLFCRFSRHFFFHQVDELWSTYRMHVNSRSSQRTEEEVLDLSIAISRRYWGTWLLPLRWRCEISHWVHNRHLHEHARHHARRAEEAARSGHPFRAGIEFFKTFYYSPKMARDRLLFAWLSAKGVQILKPLLGRDEGFTGQYGDVWIGPVYRTTLSIPSDGDKITLTLKHIPQAHHKEIFASLFINQKPAGKQGAREEATFQLTADLRKWRGKTVQIEVRCSSYFVPRQVHNTADDRQLSLLLLGTAIDPQKS